MNPGIVIGVQFLVVDPNIVRDIQRANDACLTLMTLLVSGSSAEAAMLAASDPVYTEAPTSMAIATLASSAIKSLAEVLEVSEMEILQVAGLSAAEYGIWLESQIDKE